MNDLPCETSSIHNQSFAPEAVSSGALFTPPEQDGQGQIKKNHKKKEANISGKKKVPSCQPGQGKKSQESQNGSRKKTQGSRKSKIVQKTALNGNGKKRNVGGGAEKRLSRFSGPYVIPDSVVRKAAVVRRMRNSQDLDVKTTLFLLTTIIDAFQNKLSV